MIYNIHWFVAGDLRLANDTVKMLEVHACHTRIVDVYIHIQHQSV